MSDLDRKDRKEARAVAIVLAVLALVLGAALLLLLPALADIVQIHLSPGLGLRDAAVIAFFTTVVLMVVFAIAAGDGLLGEIQFMLAAFFSFFLILWLMIAWIF